MLRKRAVASDRHLHRGPIPHFHLTEGSEGDKSSDEAMFGKQQDIADAVGQSLEISKLEDALQLALGGCLLRVAQRRLLKQLYPGVLGR